MRRWLPIGLVLLVGAIVLLMRGTDEPSAARPDGDAGSASAASSSEVEPGLVGTTPRDDASEVDEGERKVRLRIRVRMAGSGAPLPGADSYITLRRRGESEGSSRYVATNRDGHIDLLKVPEGKLEVQARFRLYTGTDAWLEPKPGPDGIAEVVFEVRDAPAFRGRVVLPPGVPRERLRLEHERTGEVFEALEVDAEGRFAYPADGDLEVLRVHAMAASESGHWYATADITKPDAPVELTLNEAGPGDRRLVFLDLVTTSGDKVIAARVLPHVRGPSGHGWGPRRLLLGRGALAYKARANEELYLGISALEPEGLAWKLVGPVRAGDLRVELGPGLELEGRVQDEEAGAVAAASLKLYRLFPRFSDRLPGAPIHEARSDEDGAFRFAGLDRGSYELVVEAPPGFVAPSPVIVSDLSQPVSVRLGRATPLLVEVLDDEGRPLAEARVFVQALESEIWASAETDAEGRAVLQSVADHPAYRVVVLPPTGDKRRIGVSRPGWTRGDGPLQLLRSGVVEGRVLGPGGAGVARRAVYITTVGNEASLLLPTGSDRDGVPQFARPYAWTDKDGKFRIEGVPPGDYEAYVPSMDGKPVRVSAGDQAVELHVKPSAKLHLRFEDWRTADYGRAPKALVRAGGPQGGSFSRSVDRDGTLLIAEREAGVPHELWISGLADGRYVWERDLRPSAEVQTVEIRQGGTIRLELDAPAGISLTDVAVVSMAPIVQRGFDSGLVGSFPFEVLEDGRVVLIHGVPPGSWELWVWGSHADQSYGAELAAKAGDTKRVRMEEDE